METIRMTRPQALALVRRGLVPHVRRVSDADAREDVYELRCSKAAARQLFDRVHALEDDEPVFAALTLEVAGAGW